MWFIGCAIGAALYIYSASLLIAKRLGGCDVRPPSVSISAFLACLMMFTHISEGGTLGKFLEFSQKWAWATLVPFALAAVVSLVRSRKGKGIKNESA